MKFIVLCILFSYFNSLAFAQTVCALDQCGVKPSCNNGVLSCQRPNINSACQWVCAPQTVLNCTSACLNITQPCPGAVCKLQLSTATSKAGCAWACPNIDCTNYCKAAVCPGITNLSYCGPSSDGSSCTVRCATSVCASNCTNSACPNEASVCLSIQSNQTISSASICGVRCQSPQCGICSPGCTPICTGVPKCIESVCIASTPGDTSTCNWQNLGTTCTQPLTVNTCECQGAAPCLLAKCERQLNNSCIWSNVNCITDCSLVDNIACKGYNSSTCTTGGICLKSSDGTCNWICPIDPCINDDGTSKCTASQPNYPLISRCLIQDTECVLSNVTSGVCQWSPRCSLWNLTSIQCTNSSCNGQNWTAPTNCQNPQAVCSQAGGLGGCQWVVSCAPQSTDQPCSPSDCPSSMIAVDSEDSTCLNVDSLVQCIRDISGRCSLVRYCPKLVPSITCVSDACNQICFDSSYLDPNSAVTPPAGFSLLQASVPFSSCNFDCANYCRGLRPCSVAPSSKICDWIDTPEYNQCLQRCNVTVNSNSTQNVCYRQDACSCNYSSCTYVISVVGNLISGSCLLNSVAEPFINNNPGTNYYLTSQPNSCLLPPPKTIDVKQQIINRVGTITANDITSAVLQRANQERNNNTSVKNYYPQIVAVFQGTISDDIITFVLNFELNGNTSASSNDLKVWCDIISDSFTASAQSNLTTPLILVSFSCNTVVNSKRSLQQNSGGGTFQGVGSYAVPNGTVPSPAPMQPVPTQPQSSGPSPQTIVTPGTVPSGVPQVVVPAPQIIGVIPSSTIPMAVPSGVPVNQPVPAPLSEGTRMSVFGLMILAILAYMF